MESSPQYGKDTQESMGFPWRALAWSLGVHALVLLALAPVLPQGETAVAPAQRLLARLQSESPVTTAVLPAPTFSVPTAPSHTPPVRPRMLAQASHPVPVEPAAPVLPSATAGGEPVPASVPTTPSVALASPAVEPAAPDAAGLRQYRLALAGEARRYKRYPDAARRAGLAGTVEVRIQVAASGVAPQTELERSSGHAQLDAAALEMLRLAAERTTLPEVLRNRQFAVLLPVVFEVEE